jgi:hypothetical protein
MNGYTSAQLAAMKPIGRPMKLADRIGQDGQLLVVQTLNSERHWVQYDKKHGVYRTAEKEPRRRSHIYAGGIVVAFGGDWYEPR